MMCNIQEIQEGGTHSQDLALTLKEIISQSIQKFKEERRAKIAAKTSFPALPEPHRKGRSLTTTLVLEETISFSHENYDLMHYKDIDVVLSNLQNWKIESRQRETKMFDMYYIHATSSRKFRSITEVVNHILPKGYPKIPTRKRKLKGGKEKAPKKLRKNLSRDGNSKITEDRKNAEMRNVRILPESLFRLPAKKGRSKRKNKDKKGTKKILEESPSTSNVSKNCEEKENNILEVGDISIEILLSLQEVQVDTTPENETLRDEEIEEILRDFLAKVNSSENKENNHEVANVSTQPVQSLAPERTTLQKEELEEISNDFAADDWIFNYFT